MSQTGGTAARRSNIRVRQLSAEELGLVNPEVQANSADSEDLGIADDDPRLVDTVELLSSFGGVIFVGPPGTSKTYFAHEIALKLTKGNSDLVRFVQFHPSYQYEDFVQGYVPSETGVGFTLKPKHLMEMCALAEANDPEWVVLVIDELSRGEPGRVFGEALTYLEKTKRKISFHLASGHTLSIPENLAFLCTMNPLDRGVDEVDAAFERRFAKIPMEPDDELLLEFLTTAGMGEDLRGRVLRFFQWVNRQPDDYGKIGHTYFLNISDDEGLRRIWNHQLRFVFEKAYRLDRNRLVEVQRRWNQIFEGGGAVVAEEPAGEVVTVGDNDFSTSAEEGQTGEG